MITVHIFHSYLDMPSGMQHRSSRFDKGLNSPHPTTHSFHFISSQYGVKLVSPHTNLLSFYILLLHITPKQTRKTQRFTSTHLFSPPIIIDIKTSNLFSQIHRSDFAQSNISLPLATSVFTPDQEALPPDKCVFTSTHLGSPFNSWDFTISNYNFSQCRLSFQHNWQIIPNLPNIFRTISPEVTTYLSVFTSDQHFSAFYHSVSPHVPFFSPYIYVDLTITLLFSNSNSEISPQLAIFPI